MNTKSIKKPWRKWLRIGFITYGLVAVTYLSSGYRTVDIDENILISDATISVMESPEVLQFTPPNYTAALIFISGSGVSSHAYAPMLRPIAEQDYGVFIIKLPYRFAMLESHRMQAIDRALKVISDHPEVATWVVSGHSLGGALASRIARDHADLIDAMALVGTTHPKADDLSSLSIPVTKVYGSNDGIAPTEKIIANKHLLPQHTTYVLIAGGNHSQFGHYAGQFLDGEATISRDDQQAETRTAILEMLAIATNR